MSEVGKETSIFPRVPISVHHQICTFYSIRFYSFCLVFHQKNMFAKHETFILFWGSFNDAFRLFCFRVSAHRSAYMNMRQCRDNKHLVLKKENEDWLWVSPTTLDAGTVFKACSTVYLVHQEHPRIWQANYPKKNIKIKYMRKENSKYRSFVFVGCVIRPSVIKEYYYDYKTARRPMKCWLGVLPLPAIFLKPHTICMCWQKLIYPERSYFLSFSDHEKWATVSTCNIKKLANM